MLFGGIALALSVGFLLLYVRLLSVNVYESCSGEELLQNRAELPYFLAGSVVLFGLALCFRRFVGMMLLLSWGLLMLPTVKLLCHICEHASFSSVSLYWLLLTLLWGMMCAIFRWRI